MPASLIKFKQTKACSTHMIHSLSKYGCRRGGGPDDILLSNRVASGETVESQRRALAHASQGFIRKVLPALGITFSNRKPSVGPCLQDFAFTAADGQTRTCSQRLFAEAILLKTTNAVLRGNPDDGVTDIDTSALGEAIADIFGTLPVYDPSADEGRSGTATATDSSGTAPSAELSWDLSSDGNGGTTVVDPVAANNWQELKIGAGGFLSGIDVAPDGTMVVRTDTYGAYIWNGTQWQQLVTAASTPAQFVAEGNNQGVYEIQIASSNSNILYMKYLGDVFKHQQGGNLDTNQFFSSHQRPE
jgi:hypothetical protein